MGDFIATIRKSTLALKLELSALTGTASSVGTAVTGSGTAFDTELTVGSVIGNQTKGYRTVTAITNATTLTVDSAFDVALSADTLDKQAFGTDPTIAAEDIIEFVPPVNLDSDRGEIANEAVNRSFDENEPVLGTENVTGSITVNLHGSGTAGTAPESDAMWQCAIGEKSATASHTTASGSTTTAVKLSALAAGDYKVGQHVMLDPTGGGTGANEVSRITAIDVGTKTLTCSPAFSVAPPTGRTVSAGIHYRTTLTELHSIWVQYWRGDMTKETYKGMKCNSLTIDWTTNQSIKPTFAFDGKETATFVAEACGLGAATPDTGDMHVGRYCVLKYAGTLYPVSSVKIDLKNEIYKREDLTGSGIKSLIRTKRTITGSIALLYESKAFQDAYKAGTTAELMMVSSTGAQYLVVGNTFVASLTKIRFTKAPVGEESGLYKYDLQFKAVRTNGEDAAYFSFL